MGGTRVTGAGGLGEGARAQVDVMRARSLDQLHDMARSNTHFVGKEIVYKRTASRAQCPRGVLEKVKGIYFAYYPSDNREEAWKCCVTAIN